MNIRPFVTMVVGLSLLGSALLGTAQKPSPKQSLTSPIGKWVGRLSFNPPPPAGAQVPKVVYRLELKKDQTFTTVLENSPDGKAHPSTGTWKLAGNKVTMTVLKRDGEAVQKGEKPRIGILSTDGKTMSVKLEANRAVDRNGKPVQLPKGAVVPNVSIVFKRS